MALKKVRLFLDIHRERRISYLQKAEKELLAKLGKGTVTLDSLKEDLKICTAHYQKIMAMNYMKRQIVYLEDKTLLIQNSYATPQMIGQIQNIIQSVGWGLYKLNSDQASEFIHIFRPFIGNLAALDNFVDRKVVLV